MKPDRSFVVLRWSTSIGSPFTWKKNLGLQKIVFLAEKNYFSWKHFHLWQTVQYYIATSFQSQLTSSKTILVNLILKVKFLPELFLRILPHKIGEDECDSRPDNYVKITVSYFRWAQDAGMIILCADNFQPQTSLPSGQLSLQLCPLLLHLVSTRSSLPQTWRPTWPSLLTTVLWSFATSASLLSALPEKVFPVFFFCL